MWIETLHHHHHEHHLHHHHDIIFIIPIITTIIFIIMTIITICSFGCIDWRIGLVLKGRGLVFRGGACGRGGLV